MTRIDHAARSDRRMEQTLSSYETGEDAGAIVVALAALNDSTLALVEQQRIANLIALAQGSDGAFSSVTRDLAYLSIASGGPDGAPHPDIAAALGIEVAS